MDPSPLSSSTYQAPSRLARHLKLNTIMEDEFPTTEEPRGRSRSRSPPPSASTISSYYRNSRSSKDFDELYDVTDSESDYENEPPGSGTSNTSLRRASWQVRKKRLRFPSLIIPSPRDWPTIEKYNMEQAKKTESVIPTPIQTIAISTEALAKLAAELPSGPPSLGSVSGSSAPSTPSLAHAPVTSWNGVEVARSESDFAEDRSDAPIELPADVLDILQHLSLDPAEQMPPDPESEMKEMQEVPKRQFTPDRLETASDTSELSQLSIPSPGGFFSSLEAGNANPWSELVPSSAIAENFYQAPWKTNEPVEEEDLGITEALEAVENELRLSQLSRTSEWLTAQNCQSPDLKKAVKFLESDIAKAAAKADKPSMIEKADPYFYEAFQTLSGQSSPTDSFIHRQTRFDAVQAVRSSGQDAHIDQLLGNYRTIKSLRPTPQRPISMMPGRNEEEETEEQRVYAEAERERQALEQIAPAFWVNEAHRYLAGGRLVNGPAKNVLEKAPKPDSVGKSEQVRVLDLGGLSQCDWAWHVAREFPNVKTYTATCDTRPINNNLRGPTNHRVTKVPNLYSLPYPDNHFDVISARNLFQYLKTEKPLGSFTDEYDLVLEETMRCLKPGGYLEFFLLDSEIVHAGPAGTRASVEFQFNLKSRGYDCAPTKSWLGRVRRTGFDNIKRAWTFLPLGAAAPALPPLPETPPPNVSVYGEDQLAGIECVQGPIGSGADAAQISSLVASWTWEQWLLKLQMEMGKKTGLVEGVGAVVEEGRFTGSGMRSISGWARKPYEITTNHDGKDRLGLGS